MIKERYKRFVRNADGAVAATYALALIPLIAVAGLAFDYSRAVSLDRNGHWRHVVVAPHPRRITQRLRRERRVDGLATVMVLHFFVLHTTPRHPITAH